MEITVKEIITKIEEAAKENVNRKEIPVLDAKVGQVPRQGDIYVHKVAEDHAHGERLTSRQLAVGSSKGSRHIAEPPCTVYEGTKLPEYCARGTFLGPFIESAEPFTISHPEHGHLLMGPGCYQVTHQMDAQTLQRVAD